MDKIINCKLLRDEFKEECKNKISKITDKLKLSVIRVGDNISSIIYINSKRKACNDVNIDFEEIYFKDNTSENEVIKKIKELNKDMSVTGIIIQLPLPKHIDKNKVINAIDYKKDVDGLTDYNIGKLNNNEKCIIPCTAKGILSIFNKEKIDLEGKNIILIGRSKLVGKPLIPLLLNSNATLTICHSKTKHITRLTKNADIIICAVGKPGFLKKNMIKRGCIIFDVGLTKIDNKIYGDVDFKNILSKIKKITPVPGGIGLMTVISVIMNIIECYELNK